ADQIVDRFGESAVEPIKNTLANSETESIAYIQGLWILFRLDALSDDLLTAAINHSDPTVKVHALRVMFELPDLSPALVSLTRDAIQIPNPHIQRQATMVLAKNPEVENIPLLLKLRKTVSEETDSHFYYSVRQSLRDHLRDDAVMAWVAKQNWDESESHIWADLMRGVNNVLAARFLLSHINQNQVEEENIVDYITHAASYIPSKELDPFIISAKAKTQKEPNKAIALFQAIEAGVQKNGGNLSEVGKEWGKELASAILQKSEKGENLWQVVPFDYAPYRANPWRLTDTTLQSGEKISLLASGPIDDNGRDISMIYSTAFTIPEKLEFYLFGIHKESSGGEGTESANQIELHWAEDSGLITSAPIHTTDFPEKITWDLKSYAGKKAFILVRDESRNWGENIAVGGFSPKIISIPRESPDFIATQQIFASDFARNYQMKALSASLE
ncbi:MAG: HEAT repeat domain-containing protein, partial [Bacteroidetes bacterium]|nr:HEAT repeat domain-containing protein [Bacteroidota bacterium]